MVESECPLGKTHIHAKLKGTRSTAVSGEYASIADDFVGLSNILFFCLNYVYFLSRVCF